MDLRQTLTVAGAALGEAGIGHALIGGFALAIFGVNRATADVDFLADGARRDEIKARLRAVGFNLIHETSEVLQFGGIGQLDVLLANRPLSVRMIRDSTLDPRIPVRVLKVEDLIGLKIQAYVNDRSRALRDKSDIQALIAKSPSLDWVRIKEYADLFGEWSTVDGLRNVT